MTYFLRSIKLPVSLLFLCITFFAANAQQTPYYNWAKALEGYHTPQWAAYNWGSSIKTDVKGNVFITGTFVRSVDFDPSDKAVDSQACYSNLGCYFAKYDSTGIHNWARIIPNAQGNAIFVDDSGYIYVGGTYYDSVDFDPGPARKTLNDNGNANFFVAKYTAAGALKWVRGSGGASLGDAVNGIAVDNQGNVFITGGMHGTVDFNELNPGSTVYTTNVLDGFVAKYDRNGNYLWSNQINGNDGDVGSDIQLDPAGNVYVCGYTGGAKFSASSAVVLSLGVEDAFIAKYTSAGGFIWAKTVGSGGTDLAGKLAIDKGGNILLSGNHSGNIIFDPASPIGTIAGNGSASNAFIAKFTNFGDFIWAKGYGGRSIDRANAVAVDDSSNVYVGGYFADTISFTPGTNYVAHPHPLDIFGSLDMFLLKLKSDGSYVWSKAFGANGGDQIKDIYLDKKYNVHFTGFIARTTAFDAGPGGSAVVNNPNANDLQNTVFCKFSQVKPYTSAVRKVSSGNLFLQAYPNPTSGETTIIGFNVANKTIVAVTDVTGKQHELPYKQRNDQIIIETSSLTSGIYFINCMDEKGFSGTVKLLKTN